ncbi:hypothetical protein CAPTEDRAFT_153271 [Capitella teleta]|uniref:Exocyst complex component 7 n=1 Tax=Capitella teleta TaxID=283909 RepID=R7TUQ5_CAPTE|nr:hypothetical protein CAPTEDRAFT_153271 [Capitella teleta]|eukprot:ELT97419.1 hypothetical protein CAPTEDRAFT_153271 [Capitella teleta]
MDNLAFLKESLGRSNTMTSNMLGILSSFESRLSKLEETIIPIYQETGNLQRRHENIEKTLASLDHVIGYYHVAEEVEPFVRDGPSTGLDNYLECMNKLQMSVQYFTANNPDSPEMSHVTALYEAGKDALEREFRNLLTRHSKPVPAVVILDALAVEEECPEEEVTPIEQLSPKVVDDLKKVSTWLLQCGIDTDYMQLYYTIRSSILLKSLQTLRDHLKSGSRDSANMTLVTQSPSVSSKSKSRDTPSSRKASRRMAFVRKASNTLRKQMERLDVGGANRQTPSTQDARDDLMDVDIDFYIASVSALLKLIQSEATLMQGIIPERHQRKIFDHLIQAAYDSVVKEGQQIASSIKRATGRHNATAVISLFPVLKHLRSMKPAFDVTLEGCKGPTRTKLASLISSLDATGAKSLEDFVENIRNDPDKQSHLPKDGTVHELTSNTTLFLEQLLDFADTAGAMLLTSDPTSLPDVQNIDRPKLKLAEFITKVMSALGLNLNNKSSTYNDQTLQAIFLLNNYNYILKSLRRSNMLDIVHMWNNEVESFYEDQCLNQKRIYSQRLGLFSLLHLKDKQMESHYVQQVKNYKQQYTCHSWSWVLSPITEDQKPIGGTQDLTAESKQRFKLKDKERQMIKDKFMSFNKEIEEITRTQKSYAVPDTELKEQLKQDNKEYVLPFYRSFRKRYEGTNFTKNPEKYIKYTERDIVAMIEQFFDSTA